MQNLQNLQNLINAGSAKVGIQYAIDYLNSLSGIVAGWPFQELSGSYAYPVHPALTTGRNIVLNGTFDSTASWSSTDAAAAISGGVAAFTACGGGKGFVQTIPIVIGRSYEVTYTVSGSSSGSVKLYIGSGGGLPSKSADGTYTESIACAGDTQIRIYANEANTTLNIDNVTVKELNIPASTGLPGTELVVDSTMQAADTSAWAAVSNATLSKQTTTLPDATTGKVLRIAYSDTANPRARQTILTNAKYYKFVGYARGDGTNAPQLQSSGGSTIWTGTSSTSWQAFAVLMTTLNTGLDLRTNTSGAGYSEWASISAIEVSPMTATISGAVVGRDATPRLGKSYYFDGVNDYVNIYSASLNSALNQDEGSAFIFAKMTDASVWTDSAGHYFFRFYSDANNEINIRKSSLNNLIFTYRAGGTSSEITINSPTPYAGYFLVSLTWSKAGDAVKAYINGVQVGTTQTGLGTWSGNLSTTVTLIGGASTSTSIFSGNLTLPWIYNRPLTAAELSTIATKAGTL